MIRGQRRSLRSAHPNRLRLPVAEAEASHLAAEAEEEAAAAAPISGAEEVIV